MLQTHDLLTQLADRSALTLDKAQLRRTLGLKEEALTVLIATGSFGMGPMEKIIETLKDFQLMVVCGHNRQLFTCLDRRHFPNVKVFGLVNNMYELMAAADVMVTKPGGLSMSEALVQNLPMIFFSAIPGQETRNMEVLKSYGIGFYAVDPQSIENELKKFHFSSAILNQARQNTQRLAKPQAALDVSALIHG